MNLPTSVRVLGAGLAVALVSAFTPASAQEIDGLPLGDARLAERERFLGFDRPFDVLDMSSDGRYVAFAWPPSSEDVLLGVIDLDDARCAC
jgi:hypothetical protein